MGIRIPVLLDGILTATAAEAAAKARIAGLRAVLEAEARRRLDTEGAAPTWKAAGAGTVRYDAPGDWTASVSDPARFGSFVAEHYPTEATAVLRLPADALEVALEALKFAGVEHEEPLVEVRPAWSGPYLEALTVDVEEAKSLDGEVGARMFTVTDAEGLLVDGVTGTRSAGKLVVSLDRNRRAVALEEARTEAEAVVAQATTEEGAGVAISAEAIRERTRTLESWGLSTLHTIAGNLGLGVSGTKASLAERIARAELATAPVLDYTEAPPIRIPVLLDGILTEAAAIDEALVTPAEVTTPTPAELELVVDPPILPPAEETIRRPYVGEGADGARRSAYIDRNEADTLDPGPRRDEVLASAEAWERQAAALEELENPPAPEAPEEYVDVPGSTERVHVTQGRAFDIEAAASREVLRQVAKARRIPAGGTKHELALRLSASGVSVEDVRLKALTTESAR